MSLENDLLAIEETLWSGGASEFRRALDDDCLVAFKQMAGVSSREEVADTVGDAQRWQDSKLEPEGVVQPTNDVAILTYRATAARGEHPPYRALVSSGYVKRNDAWKMMFHQQTPLSD